MNSSLQGCHCHVLVENSQHQKQRSLRLIPHQPLLHPPVFHIPLIAVVFFYWIQHCIVVYWIADAFMRCNVAFIHKWIEDFLGTPDKRRACGIACGNLLHYHHLELLWKARNILEGSKVSGSKLSFKIYPILWVPTGKHCSISWSSISISSFAYNKLPITQPPCCVIFNGSGTPCKKDGGYLHYLWLSWPKICEYLKNS